ncbi:MAG: signal recognition particle protein [Planctomycetota bacterium]
MLGNLSDKFDNALRKLSGKAEISESNVRDAMDDVRTALLEADVHYEVAESFCDKVLEQATGEAVLKAVQPGEQMIKIVNDELIRLLGGDEALAATQEHGAGYVPGETSADSELMFVTPGPTIVMMCGLQGSGKTTTCGKLAAVLKKRGKKVMLCAADLQRPAAVKQLEVLADQVESTVDGPSGAEVVFYGEADKCAEYGKAVGVAVKVCQNAFKEAQKQNVDVLILDTAGRLHINDDLMGELRRVNGALNPHNIMLVIDAMTGQDAVNSAKAFNDQLELDGVILTKFDSDTRGGAALTVKQITGKPIKYIGTGEQMDALEPFHPARIAGRILGMGDIVSLVERAQEQVSEEEAAALQEKMEQGKMTMDDFLSQLKKIRKMGSMKSILGMMPGIGKALKDLPIEEKQIDQTEAIIQSMTMDERKDVDLLDNSRRRRIAKGAGQDSKAVSQLVKGFEMVSVMGQQMSGMGMLGRMKSMAGMGSAEMAAMAQSAAQPGRLKGSSKQSQKNKRKFKQRKGKRR